MCIFCDGLPQHINEAQNAQTPAAVSSTASLLGKGVRVNTSAINGVRGCSAGRNERAAGAVGSGAASDWPHCAHRRAPPLHSPGVPSRNILQILISRHANVSTVLIAAAPHFHCPGVPSANKSRVRFESQPLISLQLLDVRIG